MNRGGTNAGWDPAPHFRDHHGNDYVGLDPVDAEMLVGVLERLLDLVSSPAVYEELIEHLRPAKVHHLIDALETSLSYVRHLVEPASPTKPAEASSPSAAVP